MTRAYPAYRDSGVEWLGEMPEGWTIITLGRLTDKIGSGKTPNGGAETYLDEGVIFIRSQNVHDDGLRLDDVVCISPETDEEMAGTRVQPNDILLNITGASLGRTCMVPDALPPANVNQHVCIVRLRDQRRVPFVALALKSPETKMQIASCLTGAARDGLNFEQVAGIELVLPPLPEQTAIAAFLDRETAKIDALVAEQRRLIDLLREKRQAVISHFVTKGLNPGAPLKPSGIDWLGDVPEGWEVNKFARLISISEGQVDPRDEPYASMILIAPNHIESGTGQLLALETATDQGAESGKYMFDEGAVIYSKIRPSLAKVVVAPTAGLCSADMYPLTSRGELRQDYLAWLLLSPGFTAWAVLESDRVAMPKINREKLNELHLPVPPLTEQKAIVDFIEASIAKLDTLTATAETAITLLQERRAALISAAVTGEIDVRHLSPTATEAA